MSTNTPGITVKKLIRHGRFLASVPLLTIASLVLEWVT